MLIFWVHPKRFVLGQCIIHFSNEVFFLLLWMINNPSAYIPVFPTRFSSSCFWSDWSWPIKISCITCRKGCEYFDMKLVAYWPFYLYIEVSFGVNLYRMNMHNGWLLVREASWKSWLNFHQQSPHLVSSLHQLPHACCPDTIQSHHPQGTYVCSLVYCLPFLSLANRKVSDLNHVIQRREVSWLLIVQ